MDPMLQAYHHASGHALPEEPPKRPVPELTPIATRLPPEKMAKAMTGDGNYKSADDLGC